MHPCVSVEKSKTGVVAAILALPLLLTIVTPLSSDSATAAGWGERTLVSDDNLNNTAGSDYPAITTDIFGNVYVVWIDGSELDGSGPDGDIFLKKWNATTGTWNNRDLITDDNLNNTNQSFFPDVEADLTGNVHVVWVDGSDLAGSGTDYDIFWKMWNASSETWESRVLVTDDVNDTVESSEPRLAADLFGNVHLIWRGNSALGPDPGLQYRKWNGTSRAWEQTMIVTAIRTQNVWPGFAVDMSGNVHVAFRDRAPSLAHDIFYTRLNASSSNWNPIYQVNDDDMRPDYASFLSSVTTDIFGNVYVVWFEDGDQTYIGSGQDADVFYRKFNATTGIWEPRVLLSDDPADTKDSFDGRMCSDPFGNLHIAWEDRSDVDGAGLNNYGDIFYRRWNASAGGWENTTSMTNDILDQADANHPDIACDNYGNVVITWSDYSGLLDSGPDNDIYLRMYESTTIPPDYIPTDVSPSGTEHVLPETSNLLSARVLNKGDATSSVSTIAFYNSTTPSSPFFTGSVPPLGNGETTLPYQAIWVSPDVPGTYQVTIEVDYGNNISESSEVNNFFTIEFVVEDYPPPPTNLTTKVMNDNDIFLNWTAPDSPSLDHYLIYRSTDQREFDFSTPLYNTSSDLDPLRTNWTDMNAANGTAPTEYYYVVRTVNQLGLKSITSNTAGKWTKDFSSGMNAFSLPLEPFQSRNISWYADSIPNVDFVRWGNSTGHWVTHYPSMSAGTDDTAAMIGDGYEIYLASPATYTFVGYPASMIRFHEEPGDSVTFRKSLSVRVEGKDVNLSWEAVSEATEYLVFRSERRDGLHNLSLSPASNTSNTYWKDPGAIVNGESEYYYMVVPVGSMGELGSSTYSVGVLTMEYRSGSDTFALPLKPVEPHSLDWHCDNIPNVVGIIHLMKGYWRLHAKEMPEGIYDSDALQGEGYQILVDGNSTKFTFVGY
ncbi:MAG: CARDB domain-containing protein [Thermoplasmata archaeon]